MDNIRFEEACIKARAEALKVGIGRLGEKSLHAALKYYYEPYSDSHEAKIGGFVADIVGEKGIIEIQTRQFNRLRRKLDCFLEVGRVRVVYPVAQIKYLQWMDPETGELFARRKSPRTGVPYEILPELYKIKDRLCHPNLSLTIALLEVEEIRSLNGWSPDKKKGSSRFDRIPIRMLGEVDIECPADYQKLIPPGLEERFSSGDYAKAARLSRSAAQTALNVLYHMGAVARVGKKGNAFLYQKNQHI